MTVLAPVPSPDAAAATPVDVSRLLETVGFATRFVQVQLFHRFTSDLEALDLTPGLFAVLITVGLNPGIHHGTLADTLMVKRSNMTKLVDHMVEQTLIERRSARDDKRVIELFLTPVGQQRAESALEIVARCDQAMTAGLSPDQRTHLLSLLGLVNDGFRAKSNDDGHGEL